MRIIMKIAFIQNNYDKSKGAVKELKLLLTKTHEFTQKDPDIVIAVGGDGTFLTRPR